MTKFVQRGLKRLPLALAVVAAFAITPVALAHTQPSASPSGAQSTTAGQTTTTTKTKKKQKKQQPTQLKAVTVTGSLISMPENDSVTPVTTVNIQSKIQTGGFGTASVLMGTAIASGSTEINGQFGGFLVNGGTGVQSINLLGLGPQYTLVLINGQRAGPAGVRGQVDAFDLNVIPISLVQRVQIVKAGSGTIYGSDAVAGVVNIITKREIAHPTFDADVSVPIHGGGEQYTFAFADGWNVSNGNFVLGAQWQRQRPIRAGQRSFLNCQRPRVWGASTGERGLGLVPDASPLSGTKYQGCSGLPNNYMIDLSSGQFLVPTQDGHRGPGSPVPGFKVQTPPGFAKGEVPYTTIPGYSPVLNSAYALNQSTRASLYASSNLNFGNINWSNLLLYSYRQTVNHGWREFFPATIYPWVPGTPSSVAPNAEAEIVPVDLYPANTIVKDDYLYFNTQVSGILPWTDSWTWTVNGNYSKSRGIYSALSPGIDSRNSGDFGGESAIPFGQPGSVLKSPYPPFNPFLPGALTGTSTQQMVAALGIAHLGHTTFTQESANVLFTGNIFQWWAGTAKAAIGANFRHTGLNDTPSDAILKGYMWGQTSAGITRGTDNMRSIYAQLDVPLVSGVPGFQKLSLLMSGREFRYNVVGKNGNVWRIGPNWQITPTFRIRATIGTSYVAPKLFQEYLADETGFLSQNSVDPCIQWGQSNNQHVRVNCKAAGIPENYKGLYSSVTTHAGGAQGTLVPETSRAKSFGIVWTPTFANLSVSVTYFDYKISQEITSLGAQTIVDGCYARAVYPNHFCTLFDRNSPTAAKNPNMITDVFSGYVNINQEEEKGYSMNADWQQMFSFGTVSANLRAVYLDSDISQLFSTSAASGFTTSNRIGYISNPYLVTVVDAHWKRGHWEVNWQGRYFSKTRANDQPREFSYYDEGPEVVQDTVAAAQFRQSVGVTYNQPKWQLTFGVRNIGDKKPDLVSPSAVQTTHYGNASLSATQYDYFGRTLFANLKYRL